jgi:hypothetical protein
MALGTITRVAAKSGDSSKPVFYDRISFAGDDAYPTGGTTGFDTAIQTLLGDAREVVAVIPEDCGPYMPAYLPDDSGTLKVYEGASGANAEVGDTTNLSGTTFNLMVLSK